MTTSTQHARTFAAFTDALTWARTYARECCHPFHMWRVEPLGGKFAIAVRSRNTGALAGYAN